MSRAVAAGARRLFLSSSASLRAASTQRLSTASGIKPPTFRLPKRRPLCTTRLPVELSSMVSLMPHHSSTASALLKSMLSVDPCRWGWLSEGTFSDMIAYVPSVQLDSDPSITKNKGKNE